MAARRRASSPFNPLGSLVFTAGTAALGVLLYASSELLTEPRPQRWVGTPPPLTEDGSEAPLDERIAAVTARLEEGILRLPAPEVRAQGSGRVRYDHRRYEITLAAEERDTLRAALELARAEDSTIVVGVAEIDGGQRGEVGVDGLLTHTVVVRWLAAATPVPPRVAVVIEAMGDDLLAARDLVRLPFPVAIAVLPDRTFSREVAESAHQRGQEVLLQLPLAGGAGGEAEDAMVLRPSDPPGRAVEVIDGGLAQVPYAIGVSGGGAGAPPAGLEAALERLRQRRLFFLATAPGREPVRVVAESAGVAYTGRTIVLDATVDEAAVRGQLQALLEAARGAGAAVGIGRPHRATISALQGFEELARREGVVIVALSALVAPAES
jgi:polysaccharide deacetylase 2 family uncharacterized protein YibQ